MKYTIRNGLSILLGLVATGCALAVLLQDAIRTGHWTLEHGLVPGMVLIAIGAGHLASVAIRSRHYGAGVGFGVAFALATLLTLYTSVSKQADIATAHRHGVEANQALRAARETELAGHRAAVAQATAMMLQEMTGQKCGDRCKAWKARLEDSEARAARVEAELILMGPAQTATAGSEHVAALLGIFGASINPRWLALIEPFARAWLFELTAIVALGFAFRPEAPANVPASVANVPANVANVPETSPAPAPKPPVPPLPHQTPPRPPRGPLTKELAEQDLVTLLAMGSPILNQEALAQRWGVHGSTASRWLSDFQTRRIVTTRQDGRVKRIVAA